MRFSEPLTKVDSGPPMPWLSARVLFRQFTPAMVSIPARQTLKLVTDVLRRFCCFLANRLNVFSDTRYRVAAAKDCRGNNENRR